MNIYPSMAASELCIFLYAVQFISWKSLIHLSANLQPREIGILSHLPENARSDLEDLNGKVCKEMFDGIIREVVEEIGVLPTSLVKSPYLQISNQSILLSVVKPDNPINCDLQSVPIFIGISQRLENVRPTAFFFLRCDMQSNEIHDVYCHAQDGFESTKLYSVSKVMK